LFFFSAFVTTDQFPGWCSFTILNTYTDQ